MNCKIVAAAALALLAGTSAMADPSVTRLTPPSRLFSTGVTAGPITARFIAGQKFDLQATIRPTVGTTITGASFYVDNVLVVGPGSLVPATAITASAPNAVVASVRGYSNMTPGVRTLKIVATASDNTSVTAFGNFEVVGITQQGRRAKNIIFMIGDGMGIAHRTAARIMLNGVTQGKSDAFLAMDKLPSAAMLVTHSLNSIITDSSPGAACYSTGNKSNNNQHGVFPDDTTGAFDNPRVELMPEFLRRTQNKSLGVITTSDVFDATPGSFGTHTSNRGAGTGICDQFIDDSNLTGLSVLMGGGRKWFLPAGTPGTARAIASDYVLPSDIVSGWGASVGALDASRNLLADAQAAGWNYAADAAQMVAAPNTGKLLGLFAYSNMNVALDKINKRRGASTVVDDFGFPNQPMLDEMTSKGLAVLNSNPNGFVVMIEAASIDKQAHNMDTERWILDAIEFDRAIEVARQFVAQNPDTLLIVTADHECAGINIIGASTITNANLATRAANVPVGGVSPGGVSGLRDTMMGVYEAAGFPRYTIATDGYPVSTDPDYKMLIGYAGNADRYEDWLTNSLPLKDSQQPFIGVPPLSLYPAGPLNRDVAGGFLITGQVPGNTAVHTASDIPLTAAGRGSTLIFGVMDNTDVFFRAMQAAIGGAR